MAAAFGLIGRWVGDVDDDVDVVLEGRERLQDARELELRAGARTDGCYSAKALSILKFTSAS